MVKIIAPPHVIFYDASGNPLDAGKIYIGKAGENPVTNPVQVFFDKEQTITAPQPIRTALGRPFYNNKAQDIFSNVSDLTISIYDSNDNLIETKSGDELSYAIPFASSTLGSATTTELGFIYNATLPEEKEANDVAWELTKTLYATSALKLAVLGNIETLEGAVWANRLFPVDFYGTVNDAGFKCLVSGKYACRISGRKTDDTRTPEIKFSNLTFEGAMVAANYVKGDRPYQGDVLEASWVWASPIEFVYASNITIVGCKSTNSQYDLFSFARNCDNITFIGNYGNGSLDDGSNFGGDISSEVENSNSVINIFSMGNLMEYVYNVGQHISGGCRRFTSIHDKVNRCGKAALDFVHEDIRVTNFIGSNIGQAKTSDPDFANYPGDATNVNGFVRPHVGGESAANGVISQSSFTKKNVYIEATIINMFDSVNDPQNGFVAGSVASNHIDCHFDITIDNRAQTAGYLNSNIKTANTGGANNTQFKSTFMRFKGLFEASRKGGRADINHAGKDNETHLHIEFGGGMDIRGDNANIKSIYNYNSGTMTTAGTGQTFGNVELINDTGLSPTSAPAAAWNLASSNYTVENLKCVNAFVNCLSNTDGHIKYAHTEGTAGWRPRHIHFLSGGERTIIDHWHIVQDGLTAGETSDILCNIRKSFITIGNISGRSDMTGGQVFRVDEGTNVLEGLRIEKGGFKTAGRFWFEAIPGKVVNTYLKGIELVTTYTAGVDITIKATDAKIDVDVDREVPSTNAAIQLEGNTSIAKGMGTGFGANPFITSTGTGNLISQQQKT